MPYQGAESLLARKVVFTGYHGELSPWNGMPGYHRPICRRIIEGEGVPRTMFGVAKRATAQSILAADDCLTADLRLDYYRWLWSRRSSWTRGGERPPMRATDVHLLARARVGVLAERRRRAGAAGGARRRRGPHARSTGSTDLG